MLALATLTTACRDIADGQTAVFHNQFSRPTTIGIGLYDPFCAVSSKRACEFFVTGIGFQKSEQIICLPNNNPQTRIVIRIHMYVHAWYLFPQSILLPFRNACCWGSVGLFFSHGFMDYWWGSVTQCSFASRKVLASQYQQP